MACTANDNYWTCFTSSVTNFIRHQQMADLEGGQSQLHPHPFGDGLTLSLTVLLISENVTVLWRHRRQFISSNTWNMVLRIFKMIATIGFLTALECTKFVFRRGSALTPLGSLQGGEGKGEKRGKGEEMNGRDRPSPLRKFLDPPPDQHIPTTISRILDYSPRVLRYRRIRTLLVLIADSNNWPQQISNSDDYAAASNQDDPRFNTVARRVRTFLCVKTQSN